MNKKWVLVIGLSLVVPVIVLSGCTREQVTLESVNLNNQQEGIWVTGKGKVAAVPDVALLRLGIEAQETTVAQAQSEATEAMGKVMAALIGNGVAEKDIQTQYFSIRQVTRWNDTREEEVVIGYRVRNTVNTKIRDIETVGVIIDAVALAGGDLTRIDSINFSIDDPSVYYEEARDKAMADAQAKARHLAELAGVKLGKPTYIAEGIQVPPTIYPRAEFDIIPAPAPAPVIEMPPISPGETEIILTVQVAYVITD